MGGAHGIFSVITKHFKKLFDKMHPVLTWMITFIFVNITWILFRTNTIAEAKLFISKVFCMDFGPISQGYIDAFCLPEFSLLLEKLNFSSEYMLYIFFGFAFFIILGCKNAKESMESFKPNLSNSIIVIILIIWCVFSMAGVSTFLYVNF